ncbi:winged helix-turn-helix transcriptional regulator [Candidatus Peregrinibacteria bacterium]|nr:winged helix-turn-helix transcriptional regulator [Candidatus Peregrinibacteria bacterium]
MLKRLFTSNTRIKLLTIFLMNPTEEFFIRELTRKLDEQINSVRRELDNLKRAGLLKTRAKNRKKYYYVNVNFALYEELKSIIIKAISSNESLIKDLEQMGEIKVLALAGQFVEKPTNSVDMLIVGNVDRERLTNYINNDLRTKRPIRFTVMTEEDYRYRLNCNDKFISELINDKDNQVAINKINT